MNLFNYLMNKNNKELVDNKHMLEYLLNNAKLTTITGTELNITAKKIKINELIMTKESTQTGTPTPDNPIEVKTVKGYSNLFDKDNCTIVNKKRYNDSGNVVSDNNSSYTTTYTPVKPNTTYTLQNTNAIQMQAVRVYYNDENKNFMSRSSSYDTNDFSFTTPNDCYFIQYQFRNTDDFDINKIQLIEGNTALPYVPYGTNWVYTTITNGTNTKYVTIPLNNNEVCGIGDYKDELIVDNKGKCWLNKKIKKTQNVITTITTLANGNKAGYKASIPDKIFSANVGALCNKASYNRTYDENTFYENPANFVFVGNSQDTLETLQSKFNNADLYYVLETPTLIDLNYTVDLTLYKGSNTITNSEDMTMLLKYYS